MTTLYKYIGNGAALSLVPPRDITEADVEACAETWLEAGISEALLLGSGLYQKIEQEQKQESKKKSKRGAIVDAEKDGE